MKNLKFNLGKTIKGGIALASAGVMSLTPIGETVKNLNPLAPIDVKASNDIVYGNINYVYNTEVSEYFFDTVDEKINNYLRSTNSQDNLESLLKNYKKLHDYIFNNTRVKNTYYSNLTDYERNNLLNLLHSWGNDIVEEYGDKYYFKTTCADVLDFTLKANTSNTYGYDPSHEETMEYFEETLDDRLNNYLDNSHSVNNLTNCLNVYKSILTFVKGNNIAHGYAFGSLTQTERESILELLQDWAYGIQSEYEDYSYYSQTCKNVIGIVLNYENLQYLLNNYGIENNVVCPEYPTYPTIQYPTIQYPTTPTYPTYPNVNQNTTQGNTNNTINKDWHANYVDPSIDRTYGDQYYYNDYRSYTQDNYGYYDAYGNYIPYNDYNEYNYYEEDIEDYVPKYLP